MLTKEVGDQIHTMLEEENDPLSRNIFESVTLRMISSCGVPFILNGGNKALMLPLLVSSDPAKNFNEKPPQAIPLYSDSVLLTQFLYYVIGLSNAVVFCA